MKCQWTGEEIELLVPASRVSSHVDVKIPGRTCLGTQLICRQTSLSERKQKVPFICMTQYEI